MNASTHHKTTGADTRGVRIVALIAAHIYAVIAVFQISLAMGAPLGEVAWAAATMQFCQRGSASPAP